MIKVCKFKVCNDEKYELEDSWKIMSVAQREYSLLNIKCLTNISDIEKEFYQLVLVPGVCD